MEFSNDLKALSNVFFNEKHLYQYLSDENKKYMFFIYNRNFSKKYLDKSHLLNTKGIDEAAAMDLWFAFMKNKPYPGWFWKKETEEKSKADFSEKDIKFIMGKFNINMEEIDMLIKYFPKELKEELKYYKSLETKK